MNFLMIISDQLFTWSDYYETILFFHIATTSAGTGYSASSFGSTASRLSHRALQAMRKAWLQMCQVPWPWAQVLSFGFPSRQTPSHGLRAPNRSRSCPKVSRQFPPPSPTPRGNLRDQSRTSPTKRKVLTRGSHGLLTLHLRHPFRPHAGGASPRQYAGPLFELLRFRLFRLGGSR